MQRAREAYFRNPATGFEPDCEPRIRELEAERDALRDEVVNWSIEAAELKREVERLTNKLNENSQNFQIECQSAEIEMLRAEVERLTVDLATARSATYVQRLGAEADRAHREVERLREALRELLVSSAKDDPHVKAALDGLLSALAGKR
jgi:chromosome segregation ATPase